MTARASVSIRTVDAFADGPFTGNPAAVCVLPEARDAAWMARVAMEMGLSETAFLVRRDDGSFDLRWFTPAVEVALCGHATLASAHALWETGALGAGEVARFHTKSGLLTAKRDGERIELDFPARIVEPAPAPEGLEAALGARILSAGRDVDDYLIEVESDVVVRGLAPDLGAIEKLTVRGVIVTARAAEAPYDFVSRYFAPAAGVPEDPVTGSAHCCLAPFWSARLGKQAMIGWQASKRGGAVHVRVEGERVKLGGRAVTMLVGELRA